MSNKRQNKIFIYLLIIFIIFIYISTLFIHSITDRGKARDTVPSEVTFPENNTKEDLNNNENESINNENANNVNQGSDVIVNNKDRIKVFQNGETEWSELKELDIFKNSYFSDAKIAPGVSGIYSFTIENISDNACVYNINYTEENNYNINMVYKLKKNGVYITGDNNNWVKYDNLDISNINLNANANDIYTIEWKWEDSDNDTKIGETEGANYKMFINVYAQEKEGM